jgi:hypothetical protein
MRTKFLLVTIIILSLIILINIEKGDKADGTQIKDGFQVESKSTTQSLSYEVELDRWNIFKDGTHPVETTKGINEALQWARRNNIKNFIVPEGKYLIKKGEPNDPTSRVNLVSDITFSMDERAVLQKESNGKEQYELLYIGPGIKNVTIKGGTLIGDLNSHDYSRKDSSYSGGTHEFGYGIFAEAAINLSIENVKVEQFTGDGILIGGKSKQVNVLFEEDFESGGIDEGGELISDPTKIRTKSMEKTSFNHEIFNTIQTIQFSRPQNLSKSTNFDIFFYKADGTFISKASDQEIDWSLSPVPKEATYFHAVFDARSYSGIRLEYWNKGISKNVTVKNSEISFNRRQGITVAGVENMKIINNKIHDIKGTAPQSGIDIEAGFFPNMDILIKDNKIYNNESYNVILYDGQNVRVEDNYLGPNLKKSSIGLAVSKPFRKEAEIFNNIFDGSKIAVADNVEFRGNKIIDSVASIGGPKVSIEDTEFIDSQLRLGSKEEFGIKISNITIQNNKKSTSGLVINNKPIHMSNVTIKGESTLRNITGNVAEGSVFDNLIVKEYNSIYGIDLPPGSYNNCFFESAETGSGMITLNDPGKYIFKNCTFNTNEIGLIVNNELADLLIENSTFNLKSAGEAITVKAASKVEINRNKFKAKKFPSVAISTREFKNIAIVKDNILYNIQLSLKEQDINENNR